MKYFLIALFAIGLGFGAAKVVAMLNNQVATQPAQVLPTEVPASELPNQNPGLADPGVEQVSREKNAALGSSEINNEGVKVSFVGINGTNTYEGSFGSVQSDLKLIGGVVAGSVVVDTASLITPVPAATSNWKSKTSFDVARYPTASFTFTSWKKESDTSFIGTGKLVIRGVTKTVSVPIVYENGTYEAAFIVKASDFGFKNKLVADIKLIITVPTK